LLYRTVIEFGPDRQDWLNADMASYCGVCTIAATE
jgi:hypothetical protein